MPKALSSGCLAWMVKDGSQAGRGRRWCQEALVETQDTDGGGVQGTWGEGVTGVGEAGLP